VLRYMVVGQPILKAGQFTQALETWQCVFSIPANAPAGVAINGSITRTAGGTAINTGTLPFYLPRGQAGVLQDAYISGAPALDGLFNWRLNDFDQRASMVLSAYNAQIAGRKYPIARDLPEGSQIQVQVTPLVANGGTAVTDTVFLDVMIAYSGGAGKQ
jgi:hypothetical protein